MMYFDNNATTRVAPRVFEAMKPFLTEFYGNASAACDFGRRTRRAVEDSRQKVAELIGAKDAGEIVFTSGGTESDNWAILGALEAALTVLSIRDGVIPPTLNLENQDPEIELDVVHGAARTGDISYALNNSFGFGGHNVALAFGKY